MSWSDWPCPHIVRQIRATGYGLKNLGPWKLSVLSLFIIIIIIIIIIKQYCLHAVVAM